MNLNDLEFCSIFRCSCFYCQRNERWTFFNRNSILPSIEEFLSWLVVGFLLCHIYNAIKLSLFVFSSFFLLRWISENFPRQLFFEQIRTFKESLFDRPNRKENVVQRLIEEKTIATNFQLPENRLEIAEKFQRCFFRRDKKREFSLDFSFFFSLLRARCIDERGPHKQKFAEKFFDESKKKFPQYETLLFLFITEKQIRFSVFTPKKSKTILSLSAERQLLGQIDQVITQSF